MIGAHHAIGLAVLAPLIGAVAIRLLDKKPDFREAATIITALATFALTLFSYSQATEPGFGRTLTLVELFGGLTLAFAAEPLGMLFALIASFLWIVTSIYSIGYMRGKGQKEKFNAKHTRFYVFFAVAISCALGVAFSANGLTLFFFYEALTLSTFPLVTHAGNEESKRAGRVYLFMLLGTSVGLLLFALIWTWGITGTLDFTPEGVFPEGASSVMLGALLVMYVLGIGKAALMPFHRWLPAAMVAPTPVSALLHAVAVVKAGVFAILKVVVYVFGIDLLAQLPTQRFLAYLAAFTIVATAVIALRQDNLKRRLAYSTIGQLSYIVLGALMANFWGVIGGGMHMLMHAFGKITLFFAAGAIMIAASKKQVSELRGIGHQMPFTLTAFLIGSIATVGAPPTGGMWSKWYLLLGSFNSGDWIFVAVLIVGTLMSAAYLLPIVVRAFFPRPDSPPAIEEAPRPMLIAMGITSLGCVVLFVWPDFSYDLLSMMVERATLSEQPP